MSGLGKRQPAQVAWFKQSLELLESRYYKKDPENLTKFREAIRDLVIFLSHQSSPSRKDLEPWPSKTAVDNFIFAKADFRLPGHDGATARGRLMYLHQTDALKVYLVWIYNHDQYPTRPHDDDIKRALKEVLSGNQ
jgi:hypothetical protein